MFGFSLFGGNSEDEKKDKDVPKDSSDEKNGVDDMSENKKEYSPADIENFAVDPIGNKVVNNKELKIEAPSIDEEDQIETYCGKYVREMFMSHKVRPNQDIWLGTKEDPISGSQEIGIEFDSLFRHTAIFGKTGYGKSTVMTNILSQLAFKGYGFCFVDPKGSDANKLLHKIPEERLDDVIWVEPGEQEREKIVGFNYFQTKNDPSDPKFDTEVNQIKDDFINLLKSGCDAWGNIIDTTSRVVARELIRANNGYTIRDMEQIIAKKELRERFSEIFGQSAISSHQIENVASYERDELQPLIRRFEPWVNQKQVRDVISHRESTVNLTEAVQNDKIIIVKASSLPSDRAKALITTSLIRRIWSTIQTREEIPESQRTPFFIALDELDLLDKSEMDLDTMLSKGRSLKLGMVLANQYPSQLSKTTQKAVYSNCENLFTFNPGNDSKDASSLSSPLEVSKQELWSLGRYQMVGRRSIGGKTIDPEKINTFAPFPPLHDNSRVEKAIEKSLEKYGVKRGDEEEEEEYGLREESLLKNGNIDSRTKALQRKTYEINSEGDTVTEKQILESIYTAGFQKESIEINEIEGWVTQEQVEKELSKYCDSGYVSMLANAIEEIDEGVDKTLEAGEAYIRLNTIGENKIFSQSSGSGADGGGQEHRQMLKEIHKTMKKLGYIVKIPEQMGGLQQPDGLAVPPIKPVEEGSDIQEARELEEKLSEEYSRLYDLFGTDELAIEAESTTLKRPSQTIRNLSKALKKDRHCVLVVKEPSDESQPIDYWVRRATNVLSSPEPCVRSIDEDGNRWFYNINNSRLNLRDGSHALYKKEEQFETKWKEKGERIILEDPDNSDDILISVSNIEGLTEIKRSKFDYYCYKNNRTNEIVIKNSEGETVETFDNKKQVKDAGYNYIKEPLIPEKEFNNSKIPDPSMWDIVLIPNSSRNLNPHIKRNGELRDIFTGKELYKNKKDKEEKDKKEKKNKEKDSSNKKQSNKGSSSSLSFPEKDSPF